MFICVPKKNSRPAKINGFTLVELSIVIVIIGLIVGAIIVGRSILENAQLRKQISQVDQVLTAVNAFRLKYNALPGDISNATAIGLGSNASIHDGNGNWKLDVDCFNASHSVSYNYSKESYNFFMHLSAAGLIEDSYTGYVSVAHGTWWTQAELDASFLKSPRFSNTYLIPSQYNSTASCTTETLSEIDNGGQGVGLIATNIASSANFDRTNITGVQATLLDAKVDDGVLGAGNVRMQSASTYRFAVANTTLSSCLSPPVSTYPNCSYVRGLHWINRF